MQQTILRYRDSADAGSVLAEALVKYAGQNVAVFGVGPGGVAVAAPIAQVLGADLDVLAVRRLTMPGHPDEPWGAAAVLGAHVQIVAEHGPEQRRHAGIDPINNVRQRDLTELRELENTYRAGRPPEPITGRIVIVVTDGLTGLTVVRAATSAIRRNRPSRLIIALPAGTTQMCRELGKAADGVICPHSLGLFHAATEPIYCEPPEINVREVRRLLST